MPTKAVRDLIGRSIRRYRTTAARACRSVRDECRPDACSRATHRAGRCWAAWNRATTMASILRGSRLFAHRLLAADTAIHSLCQWTSAIDQEGRTIVDDELWAKVGDGMKG
jgi:hypothetical protein